MDYQKIYNDLVDRARSLNRSKGQGLYLEAHHIIPKCLGGEGHQVEWKTHPNIVLLTGREHFIAHLLLCEIYPTNSKLKHALWAMCNQQTKFQSRDLKITARMYEYIKQLNAQALKGPRPKQPVEANKKRSLKLKGRPSPNKGRKASAETRAKLSRVRKGRVVSSTTRSKISNSKKGKSRSQEVRSRISQAQSITIVQLTLQGHFIREWKSAVEAATYLGIHPNPIRGCCKGQCKSAGGYRWGYKS
jgi:hypothetical protein